MKSPPIASRLSDDLEALLDAERDIEAPTAAERKRMHARVAPLLLLPIGAAATGAGVTAAGSAAGSAKLWLASLLSAAIGASGGALGYAYIASRPAPQTPPAMVASPAALPASAPVAEAPEVPTSAAPIASVTTPIASVAAPAPSSSARLDEPTKTGSSLRAERLLLETASAALMRGDTASAISALNQHAQKFPKGQLAQERQMLLAQARAASGDDASAKDSKQKQGSGDMLAKPK